MTRGVNVRERLRGALWGMFVGDALAMPVHWYYDIAALRHDFGTVRDFQAPKGSHPSSIMPLASTGHAGRGAQDGEVVGQVILHGKKHLWGRPNQHYHHGLRRGDNTLNLLCLRVLLRCMNAAGRYDAAAFLDDYVQFMTTPGSHHDTYAESYHRDFFANYARGIAPQRCAGRESHDTASIGGLVTLPPVVFAASNRSGNGTLEAMLLTHLRLTHRSSKLEPYAVALGQLLVRLATSDPADLETAIAETAKSVQFPVQRLVEQVNQKELSDQEVIGGMLSPACYIDQSFPAVLYLAAKYSHDFESALVANTNVGGDNCHRGAVLGAILGAALGYTSIPERWISGLASQAGLETEIESFVTQFS